jgi:hypothetical protein
MDFSAVRFPFGWIKMHENDVLYSDTFCKPSMVRLASLPYETLFQPRKISFDILMGTQAHTSK